MPAASAGGWRASRTEGTKGMRTEGKRAVARLRSDMMTMRIDRRGFILVPGLLAAAWCLERRALARGDDVLIVDDFSRDDLISALGTPWRGFSDQVMGGISEETIALATIDGRRALRLTGEVRLENNGGFIQTALDLAPEGRTLDASSYTGVLLIVRGNGESYGVHLRTPDCMRPWQSYRADFVAEAEWREIRLPFASFEPYRLTEPLDVRQLRRIGLVAIGRAFHADLAVGVIGLYR
jgi:hypothetical protein